MELSSSFDIPFTRICRKVSLSKISFASRAARSRVETKGTCSMLILNDRNGDVSLDLETDITTTNALIYELINFLFNLIKSQSISYLLLFVQLKQYQYYDISFFLYIINLIIY